jgi:hypothetical protein
MKGAERNIAVATSFLSISFYCTFMRNIVSRKQAEVKDGVTHLNSSTQEADRIVSLRPAWVAQGFRPAWATYKIMVKKNFFNFLKS